MDPGQVAARPREARDQPKSDRVIPDAEDNRDRCGRVFCLEYTRERGDHGHATPNQVGNQRRDAIKFALQPVVLDGDVLTFDVAGFTKPPAERSRRRVRGRRGGDDPDHGQVRLLRLRRERPRGRATEPRDELTPPHP